LRCRMYSSHSFFLHTNCNSFLSSSRPFSLSLAITTDDAVRIVCGLCSLTTVPPGILRAQQ
jgi:hypothetical protein